MFQLESVERKDQTIKQDAGKAELILVPSRIITDIAEVRMYGNLKYHDSQSWRQVDLDRYKNAHYRHWLAFIEDAFSKDESGLYHYQHCACNMAFICDMMYKKILKGERYE